MPVFRSDSCEISNCTNYQNNKIASCSDDLNLFCDKNETVISSIRFSNIELKQITPFFIQNRKNLKCIHLNINSVRYKFAPLADILTKSMIDILSLQETKLDDSFPHGQYSVIDEHAHKYKTEHNWMRYKSHRKHVNYLRRKSLETFINLKCSQPNKCNGNDFWHTVRPLISDKSTKNSDQIILSEEGKIINKLESVSNILNEYYVNMAQKIGPPDMIKH